MLFFNKKYIFLLVCLVVSVTFLKAQMPTDGYRPVFHFTPAQNWINDPNGLVYYDGEYHLFYQYNPSGSQWGNMSWGHAVSSDLFGWQELPVALPVVNEVMAFSGSAVMDWNNSSGFGDGSLPPLVAVYTAASQGNQRQHVAYSTDRGRTWQQYAGNPVLNLFDDNFRDPKVIWFAPSQQWIMVVALPDKHRVRFYSSDNLKEWNFLSDFGNAGDQSGAWECPDLFPLPVNGNPANIKWVLQVDVTPGKSQYFIGHFNGQQFLADDYPEETIDDLPYGDVIGSFDGNTYGGWSISGTAFGTAPAQGALPNQLPVAGFLGTGLANSYNGGDQSIGTLTSPVFNITQRYLNFKFGGGRSDKATIALFINNEKIYSRTGNKDEYLYWESWNVNDYQGQQAQVVITDSATGGWGHILADHFFMSAVAMTQGEPPVGNIIADFEQATYTGWQVSGCAFGSAPASGALPGQQAITGFLGGQLVNSYMGGDAATGKMISTDFVIDSSYIAFLIGGGHHPDKAFIRLIADGVVVGEATGDDSETLQWKYWDVQTLTGTEAHIEIIDSATAGWGHINVDHIIQTNQLPQNPPVCRVDYGMDFYAAQSYADIPANDGRRLWLAWMSNWSYAGITPTAPWRGAMTVPRQVRLADDDGTIILMQQPVKELQLLRDSVIRFDNQFLNEIKHALDSLRMQVFELDVTMVVDQSNETGFEIRTSNTQHTLVKYDAQQQELIFDRSASGALTGNTDFARVQQAPLPAENGKIRLQILVDRSSIEIFANGGKVVMTNLIFPDTTSNGMKIFATGGEVFIDSLKIWKIKAPNSGTPVPEINKAPADQIRIFPNPAAQQDITIQLLHSLVTRKFVCNIYDGIGNKITTITEQGLHHRYDIANNIFPANGIYLVQILTDAGSTTRKLLIKR